MDTDHRASNAVQCTGARLLESTDTQVKGSTTIERLNDSFVVIRNSSADKKPGDTRAIGYSDPRQNYLK